MKITPVFLRIMLFFIAMGTTLMANMTADEFAQKLKPLASKRSIKAEFRQIRHFNDLDFDMTIKGSMAQEAGKRLIWRTDSPIRTACLFTPASFQFWDGETNKTTTFGVDKFPWIKLIFKLQSQWMSGDLQSLKQDFDAVIIDSHTLSLTPKGAAMKAFFQNITVRFSNAYDAVERALFREKNGDLITIDFHHIVSNPVLPPETWLLN